jgi:hypothetical protein
MNEVTFEGPKEITISNVQFWCKHGKELRQTQRHKAQQFIEYDCIRYVGDDPEFNSKSTFICLPLNPNETVIEYDDTPAAHQFNKKPFPVWYNNSTYKIFKNEQGIFECNCQGWQTKAKRGELGRNGCHCSHVLALFYCFKMRLFGKKHGATEDLIKPDLDAMESMKIQKDNTPEV